MSEEETRCCGAIVARIDKLEEEESALLKESIAVEKQLETTSGFFACLSLKSTLHKLDKERERRRLALIELSEARIRIKETMIREMDFQIRQAEIERHLG
jgi:hypothetical protein